MPTKQGINMITKTEFDAAAKDLGIGNTPLLPFEEDLPADVYFKYEAMNASGSVKDRAALAMILDAEKSGLLHKGDTIVEATSGNMGISLAYVGRAKGYNVLLAMPETMSVERRQMLAGLGAQLVLTEGALGMKGSIDYVEQISNQNGHVWLKQFSNPANALAHYLSTGEEICNQLDRVDIFVAGVGTGGTLIGAARKIKEHFPNCQIIAVEPASSPAISRGEKGPHKIQGIGAGFVTDIYDPSVVDEVQLVTDDQAMDEFKLLNKKLGYCCGISAAANIVVATRLAELPENAGKNIVTLFPDSDDRYQSILNAHR